MDIPTMETCFKMSPASISFVFIKMMEAPTHVSPLRIEVSIGDEPLYLLKICISRIILWEQRGMDIEHAVGKSLLNRLWDIIAK